MPIYEYSCQDCGHQFETLVRNQNDRPHCPSCTSENLSKELSVPAVARAHAGSSSSLPVAGGDGPGFGGCGVPGCGPGGCASPN